jgi:hypothetical protein
MSKTKENLERAINVIEANEFKIIFVVPDTKGSPKGAVAQTHMLAKELYDAGYNVVMLYENVDFTSVEGWLGEEYAKIPTEIIEENTLQVSGADILIIPEAYGHIVEQTANLPVNRVVFVQDYENMLATYTPSKVWTSYGVTETITTSEKLKEMIQPIIHSNNIEIVQPIIDNSIFYDKKELRTPLVSIHTHDTQKAAKIIKEFYLKYPALKWISFKDIHAIPYAEVNNELNKTCLSIWVDHDTSFGTFPVESLKTNTPVVALVPSKLPEWYEKTEDSVIWTYDESDIVDYVAKFIKSWLEDSLPIELTDTTKEFIDSYNLETVSEQIKTAIENIQTRRINSLKEVIANNNKETEKAV